MTSEYCLAVTRWCRKCIYGCLKAIFSYR